DVTEIVILSPVLSHRPIDLAGQLVPDRFWITIASDRRVHSLPDVPLPTRTTIIPEREFHVVHVFDRRRELAEVVPLAGPRHLFPLRVGVVSILMLVNIDDGVSAKIDGIGTRDPRAVVLIRVENLCGHCLPATGRAAVEKARPAFADPAK